MPISSPSNCSKSSNSPPQEDTHPLSSTRGYSPTLLHKRIISTLMSLLIEPGNIVGDYISYESLERAETCCCSSGWSAPPIWSNTLPTWSCYWCWSIYNSLFNFNQPILTLPFVQIFQNEYYFFLNKCYRIFGFFWFLYLYIFWPFLKVNNSLFPMLISKPTNLQHCLGKLFQTILFFSFK